MARRSDRDPDGPELSRPTRSGLGTADGNRYAAVSNAPYATGARVRNFAVGALFPEKSGEIGAHLFSIEFADPELVTDLKALAAANRAD